MARATRPGRLDSLLRPPIISRGVAKPAVRQSGAGSGVISGKSEVSRIRRPLACDS